MWIVFILSALAAIVVAAYVYWLVRIKPNLARFPKAIAIHDIVDRPSLTSASDISIKKFIVLIREAERAGLTFATIEDWLESSPRENKLLLTFDDGFESFYTRAYPILREKGIPSALFLLGGFTGARPAWDYRSGGRRHLTHDEITELKDDPLVAVCSHSRSHPDLRKLSERQLEKELRPSVPGAKPCFSYPFGAFDKRVVEAVRSNGYSAAFGTLNGPASEWDRSYAIPRIPLNRFDNRFTIRTKLTGGLLFWMEILKARIIGAFAPFTFDWRGRP